MVGIADDDAVTTDVHCRARRISVPADEGGHDTVAWVGPVHIGGW